MKKRVIIFLGVLLVLFAAFSFLSERGSVSEFDNDAFLLERTLRVTNGVTHSVPLNSIISGGPPKDGIPSIDRPRFVSIEKANEYLNDAGLGISVAPVISHETVTDVSLQNFCNRYKGIMWRLS